MPKHHGHHSHHGHHGHHKHHSGHPSVDGNPDVGPPMHEGAHHFDKGYVSDEEHFSPRHTYPHEHERGNRYMHLQNEAVKHDSKKLERSRFSKIA